MMAINDFSALIQLSATISIAFVAVEYVRSFTSVLCEKFFMFQVSISQAFKGCLSCLTDRETLDHIEPMDINGRSTNTAIEQAKRKNESLRKKIIEEEEHKKNEVALACQARSMSTLCYFLFLFNTFLLLLGSLEGGHPSFSHVSIAICCTLADLFLICGWMFGEKEKPLKYCNFSSLRHVTYYFVAILFLSVVFTLLIFHYVKDYSLALLGNFWWYLLLSNVVFSYINFIVFVVKIWNKAQNFKKKVEDSADELKKECAEAEKEVNELLSISRLSARLEG